MGTRDIASTDAAVWDSLMDEMAEACLELTDVEMLTATVNSGENVAATASGVKSLLLGEVKKFRQERLNEALVEYQQQVAKFKERSYVIPEPQSERRQLLSSLFHRYPQVETTFLTLQHRDFKSLSDADVDSLLKQLEALGVFEKDVLRKK